MKVTGSTIEQLDKKRADGTRKPKSECRKWRIWATTEEGRKSKRLTGTYSQAQKAQKAYVAELEAVIPNSDTFAAYADSWHAWREKSGNYSPNTIAAENVMLRSLKRTPIASMRMDAITPQDCRDAISWLKDNPINGEYKQSTIAQFHQALNAVLSQAEADGLISSNPMAHVKRPKKHRAEREALSPEELQLFLNRVDSLPLDGRVMALYLMACLGLRMGEALALHDDCITGDFVRVVATLRSADNTTGPPKSQSGVRTLPIPQRLKAKMEEWTHLRNRLGLREAKAFCCKFDCGRYSASSLDSWWRKNRDKLGCSDMTLHQLRHSNLSMMARYMSPFDLQRYAGWSSIEPARIYIHDDLNAVSRAAYAAWESVEVKSNAPKMHQA